MGNSRQKVRKLEDQEFQRKERKKRGEIFQRNNLRNLLRTDEYELPVERVHPILSTVNNF